MSQSPRENRELLFLLSIENKINKNLKDAQALVQHKECWTRNRLDPIAQYPITSKMCENISHFQQKSNQSKIRIFWHVFSVLSNRIKLIAFYERPASQNTHLKYQQQGNRSNVKINFFRIRGVLGEVKLICFGKHEIWFGYLEIIGEQMRYWLN